MKPLVLYSFTLIYNALSILSLSLNINFKNDLNFFNIIQRLILNLF